MPTWLSTTHIGPLTGPADQNPPPLQDTRRWGVEGVDEGVSVIFQGRTYIYFGDVNPSPFDEARRNLDLIAWTGEPHVHTHGGHLALGWTFYLPNSNQQSGPASTQQPKWRYCVKCFSLFYCPAGTGAGRCTYDNGFHNSAGYEFYLPNIEEGATASMGQPDWHYCGKCNGLCYAPNMVPTGSCPAGGSHDPMGWNFVLPNNMQGATSSTGQGDWRYCAHCKGLFFDAYVHKGACPSAPGGGLRLIPVLESGTQENGRFFPFRGEPLVGVTKSDERPGGAFVWNDRVYVFANVYTKKSDQTRPGNPQYGTYLLSTETPDQPRQLTTHYLVSPRIGKCTLPDGTVRSHNPLGVYFSLAAAAGASTKWRRCKWCESLFELVPGNPGRCFGNPAGHTPYDGSFVVDEGTVDNATHQSNWRRCAKCLMVVFNGFASKQRCPTPGGMHDLANSQSFSIAFTDSLPIEKIGDGGWRYCAECQCMVFTDHDNTIGGATPYVVTATNYPDLPAPPSAGGIAFSGQAAVIISHRFGWRPFHNPGFNLACWHLPVGAAPRLQDLLYFDPESRTWTPDVSVLAQKNLFDYAYQGTPNPDNYYTETGLLWLPGPRQWMLTYTQAQASDARKPVYARFAAHITDLGNAADVPIFDPSTRPADQALIGAKSYPYGPYPLERYTSWDPRMGILDLHYLLSLSDPIYQVQIMLTQIRIP
jgi:hypothetical protein